MHCNDNDHRMGCIHVRSRTSLSLANKKTNIKKTNEKRIKKIEKIYKGGSYKKAGWDASIWGGRHWRWQGNDHQQYFPLHLPCWHYYQPYYNHLSHHHQHPHQQPFMIIIIALRFNISVCWLGFRVVQNVFWGAKLFH